MIVSFAIDKRSGKYKKFIEQIKGCKAGRLEATFLRSKFTREFLGYVYQYPQIEDITTFSFFDIVEKLDSPIKYGRGLLRFNVHANRLQ